LDYTLHIRAFFDTTSTDDAARFALATFPDLPVTITGPYWKIETLTEAVLHHDIVYADDDVAYRDTLAYFHRIATDWMLRGPDSESVIDGLTATTCGQHMTWCHFELVRRNLYP
jgi:hypothetical protein